MSHIYVMKYWLMQIFLIVLEPLLPINLVISIISLRILLIIDFVSGKFISTRRLWSLLRNFMCVMSMSCNLSISLPISPLFNRFRMNIMSLLTKNWQEPDYSKE